ncbi:MAG: zinc ribbon domain-containing protein [Leptospiraceae bacterium]|nr:zinc ribbon domain-containing protein [Leptospiraceae bacterium]
MTKQCTHCGKENDASNQLCSNCGNPKFARTKKKFFADLPSWAYLILFIATIVSVIGGFILFTVAISSIEGFASILFLMAGYFVFIRYYTPMDEHPVYKAMAIGFFAIMGMALDQSGNYIYNLPFQSIFCDSNERLHRDIRVTHRKPGSTEFTQDFQCYNDGAEKPERGRQISLFRILGIRFLEYVGIGYLLIWIGKIRKKIYNKRHK